jgi:hypothetical protein
MHMARFQAAVRMGDEQIERGETMPYSKDLMEQRDQHAVQRAQQGKKIDNPDILPYSELTPCKCNTKL